MRQPEVARLAPLVLALALVVPVARAAVSVVLAGAFLAEFLSAGALPALSRLTAPPVRTPLAIAGVSADRWVAPALAPPRPLLVVHGVTPDGKDDPRLAHAAALLARLGFDVAVPTIPGLTRARLRPDDVEPVRATLAARGPGQVVIGVSLGAGPALLAAADPRVRDRVRTVVSLGGYASAASLVRFFLTGEYAFAGHAGHVTHDPALVRAFVHANADLLAGGDERTLAGGDRRAIDAFLGRPTPSLHALLDALSPERVARAIPGRVVLVHGRHDPAVPYTESLRLAAARRPEPTTVILVGVVEHVDSTAEPAAVALRDLLALWGLVYSLGT